jgi:hypothetical protein
VQPQGPPLSTEEEDIQKRFYAYLLNSEAFLRYVLTELFKQKRIIEVLALPSSLHQQMSDFLTSVRRMLTIFILFVILSYVVLV